MQQYEKITGGAPDGAPPVGIVNALMWYYSALLLLLLLVDLFS